MKHILLIVTSLIMFNLTGSAQSMIAVKDAIKHISEKVTICDKVFSQDNRQFVVTLFLGGDQPNQLLTVVIRASSKTKFKGHFDADYRGKDICVAGVITKGQDGKPIIKVTDPNQIKPFMVDNPVKEKSSLN
ncbi:MAG TPA: hypothetical protein VK671_14245 [Mucilaginibacter sp.]|nr:hypothetical protein [Mucilaginibacter sp.]